MSLRLVASCAAVLLAPALAFAAEGPVWQPAKTYAFVASVVTWKEPSLGTFSRPRLDNDLVATLKAAGVPANQVAMLKDQQATLAAVRSGLIAMAKRAGDGSTLIFYFQGHGLRRHGKTTLAVHDVQLKDPQGTGLTVDEVGAVLEAHFRGERLILFGDCCHSGALGEVAARLAKRGVKAAALTSSQVSNRSTSHWTYTEALIAAFKGEPVLDRDGSGAITFAEVDRFVRDEMKFAEGQRSYVQLEGGFEEGFVLRSGAGRASQAGLGRWKVGDYLRAKDLEGKWYGARVVDVSPAKKQWKVHFPGWDPKWDEWVGDARVEPIVVPKLGVGRRYEVEWQPGQWYLATVIKGLDDFFWFVHYAGEEGEDDEWITHDRARPVTAGTGAPEFVARDPRPVRIGGSVAARWKTRWYLATVTARTPDGLWRVHYADDTHGAVVDDELFPVLAEAGGLAVGDRVLACWKGQPQMYGGTVVGLEASGARVKWDDGSPVSTVALGKIAVVRDAPRPAEDR